MLLCLRRATCRWVRPGFLFALAGVLAAINLVSAAAAGQPATWEQWRHIPGIFDVTGPRSDGAVVVAAGRTLSLVDAPGSVTPFASGPTGYHETTGGEAYIALSPGLPVNSAGCAFARDDLFALRLQNPIGVTRIDPAGQVHPFANVSGVDSLNGIAFDTVGRFGHRLLVTGPHQGRSVVDAIDCAGAVTVVTAAAPTLEGGLAVAPSTFTPYAGDLIAPDELSGRILAISPEGIATTIADSGLPHGGDIGVEGAGFAPPGFRSGGWAYFADRATPGNPHPGTDSLLRLDDVALTAAGVRDGDLLLSTEGGALTIAVRCASTCTVIRIAGGPSVAHGEGHVLLVAKHPVATTTATVSPSSALRGGQAAAGPPTLAIIGLLLVAVALMLVILRATRRRTPAPPNSA
jgi:hypothetical protein